MGTRVTKTSHQDMLRNDAVVSFHAFYFFKCNESYLVPSNSWMHPILTYLGPGHFESWWWSTPTKKCVDPNNWRAASVRNIQLPAFDTKELAAGCILHPDIKHFAPCTAGVQNATPFTNKNIHSHQSAQRKHHPKQSKNIPQLHKHAA